MQGSGNKLLGAIAGPVILLALIGMLLGMCSGEPACPVDPLTGKQVCSKYKDYEGWSRAVVAEAAARDR
jgi:hypothetical protein